MFAAFVAEVIILHAVPPAGFSEDSESEQTRVGLGLFAEWPLSVSISPSDQNKRCNLRGLPNVPGKNSKKETSTPTNIPLPTKPAAVRLQGPVASGISCTPFADSYPTSSPELSLFMSLYEHTCVISTAFSNCPGGWLSLSRVRQPLSQWQLRVRKAELGER